MSAYSYLEAEVSALRRMLFLALNDGTGYGDDGEMQLWSIDFKRDAIWFIEKQLNQRAWKRFAAEAGIYKPCP